MKEPIHKYFKVGTIQWMSYPKSDPMNSLLEICRDDYFDAKNCIITPHISWAPRESRQRIMDITTDNIRAFINGKPVNVVNK